MRTALVLTSCDIINDVAAESCEPEPDTRLQTILHRPPAQKWHGAAVQ